MPALAINLIDWIIWCKGLLLYAVCGWGDTILMSLHLFPWTTHILVSCDAPSCPRKALPQTFTSP